jgi:2'-5' RNA ligase
MTAARSQGVVRTFVAVDIEPSMRTALGALQAQLKATLRGIRFQRPDGIHLTLRFLGQTPVERIEPLCRALAALAASSPPTEAPVRGLGAFPDRGRPRVLWLGIAVPPSVVDLQQACERIARSVGFPPEERPFRAHLTLGRWREPAARPELPPVDLGVTSLLSLSLMKSDLRPEGAAYEALGRFALGRAEPEAAR